MHISYRRELAPATNHRLQAILLIWFLLLTGATAQQPVTTSASDRARPESSQPALRGADTATDAARIALPDTTDLSNTRGIICGTVMDGNGEIIPGATVTLQQDGPTNLRKVTAGDNAFFQFSNLDAGASYRVTVHADGFADWNSETLHLDSGQVVILNKVVLRLKGGPVSVTVTASTPEELATEQVHLAEQQRVLGFIPNFYAVYDRNPAPLTTKLKFKLALRVAVDPVTFAGVAVMASIDQGANTPNYVQGVKGFGQRAGALYADAFADTLLAGAVLPTLLHQDPRYFYQGTGTTKSRLRHAILSPFVCKGDNGRWQPNYSSLGGDLGTTALSEAYYPRSNRGYGLVFGNFLIGTGERVVSGIAQEFLLRKLTPGAAKND
jgi:hypothetical protein